MVASTSDGPFQHDIRSFIERTARIDSDAPAIAAPKRRTLTYRMLLSQMDYAARWFERAGINPEDCIATVLPNGPEAAVAFLAVSSYAACAPLNPGYGERELDFFLSDLRPKALIVLEGDESPATDIAGAHGIDVIRLHPLLDGAAGIFALLDRQSRRPVRPREAKRQRNPALEQRDRANDVALILHTSGTTSRPKMVPLTHSNLGASARSVVETLGLTPEDRCLNMMPLFHIHGLVASLLASLRAGGSVICSPGFFVTDFFRWLDAFRPTWFSAVPTMHQSILERARRTKVGHHALRLIRSSSAPLPPEIAAGLEHEFGVPVIEAYGMTEAAHQMASNPLPPGQRKSGSVGLAAGPEIVVIGEAGDVLPAGQIGEIAIRGSSVMSGYIGDPEANRTAFIHDRLRTGDQGYLDEDGYLFVTGRLKELINRGGEKIAPREIDEVLSAHPSVLQAAAFAVKDSRLGEDVAAAVVRRPNVEVSARQLQEYAAARLAPFKIPRLIVFVDEIPKGPTGKIQRAVLAEQLGIEPEEAGRTEFRAPVTPLEKIVANLWSDVLDIQPISAEAHFLDLGGDSLLATRLLSRIREKLGVEVSIVDLFNAATVAQQASELQRLGLEYAHGS